MYDSYFQTCATLLFADGREHPLACPMNTFVFYLYLLTVNVIIHTYVVIQIGEVADCSIEADDCRTSFFNVTTRCCQIT